jgi:hypothetical protein
VTIHRRLECDPSRSGLRGDSQERLQSCMDWSAGRTKHRWFDRTGGRGGYRDRMVVKWLDEPEPHDYNAATDYLSLIAESDAVSGTVDALKATSTTFRKAKDILRAAQMALLTDSNVRVKGDPAKIGAGKKLSPILLVRGDFHAAAPLQIADGYHRVCASHLTDENTPIPRKLVSWQPR